MPLTPEEREELQKIERELENRQTGKPKGFQQGALAPPPDPSLLRQQEEEAGDEERMEAFEGRKQQARERTFPTLRETQFPDPPQFEEVPPESGGTTISPGRDIEILNRAKDNILRDQILPILGESAGGMLAQLPFGGPGMARMAARAAAAGAGGMFGRGLTKSLLDLGEMSTSEMVTAFLTEATGETLSNLFRPGRLVEGAKESFDLFRQASPGVSPLQPLKSLKNAPQNLSRFIGRGSQDPASRALNEIRTSPFTGLPRTALSPSQATINPILDFVENAIESAIAGAQRPIDLKQGQNLVIRQYADDLVSGLGKVMDPENFGHFIRGNIKRAGQLFRRFNSTQFESAIAPAVERGVVVSAGPLTKAVDDITQNILKTDFGEPGVANLLDKQVREAFGNMIERGGQDIPFAEADQIRKNLGKLLGNPSVPRQAKLMIGQLQESLWEEMGTAARVADLPEVVTNLSGAIKSAREGFKVFQDAFIESAAKRHPEAVARSVFEADTSQLRVLESAFERLTPDTMDAVRANYLGELLKEATDPATGIVSGQVLAGMTTVGKEGMGAATSKVSKVPQLKFLFRGKKGKVALESLKTITNTLKAMQKINPAKSGSGGFLMQMVQASALITLGSSAITGRNPLTNPEGQVAVALLVAPAAVGRLMLSPTGLRLLSEGLATKAGTRQAGRILTRLGTLAAREGLLPEQFRLIDQKELEKIKPGEILRKLVPIPSTTFKNIDTGNSSFAPGSGG